MNRDLAIIVLGFGLGAVLWSWGREAEAAAEPVLDPEWVPGFEEWPGWSEDPPAEPVLDPEWVPVFEEWPGWSEDPPDEDPQQREEGSGLSIVEEVIYGFMPVTYNLENANLQAFLAMIRYAEGTSGANGYRTLFGGGLFDSFDDHPRQFITASLGGSPITSSAAGAYQFLMKTWDDVRALLKLPDFSPASQDKAATFLIRRRGALADVYAGRFDAAIAKCNKEWASLPGSPYGQPVKSLTDVRRVYVSSGGQITGGSVFA